MPAGGRRSRAGGPDLGRPSRRAAALCSNTSLDYLDGFGLPRTGEHVKDWRTLKEAVVVAFQTEAGGVLTSMVACNSGMHAHKRGEGPAKCDCGCACAGCSGAGPGGASGSG